MFLEIEDIAGIHDYNDARNNKKQIIKDLASSRLPNEFYIEAKEMYKMYLNGLKELNS